VSVYGTQGATLKPIHLADPFTHSADVKSRLGLLLMLHLLNVEREFFTFEDVPVASTALAWSRRDACEESAPGELILHGGVNLSSLLPLRVLLLHTLRSELRFLRLSPLILPPELDLVVLIVPLFECMRIDLYDGILHQGLRSHQLVVRCVVDDVEDTNLLRDVLRAPTEVSRVEPQSSVLHVSSSASHRSHALGPHLGHRRRAAHLILALLLVNVHATARLPMLVPRITTNAHRFKVCVCVCVCFLSE